MKTTSISHLKARLSAFLDVVRGGGEVVVTDRGRPIAKIVPIGGPDGHDTRRDTLLRSGALKPPSKALPKSFWKRRRPGDPDGRSVQALLEERSAGW